MDRLVLTRTLFPLDEVVYSIALYVFHERDLEKTIYWLCEFYYSGYEHKSWDLVWSLYYDFFAFSNPNMEKYISYMERRWYVDKEIAHLINVLANLIIRRPDYRVFLLQQDLIENGCKKIIKECYMHKRLKYPDEGEWAYLFECMETTDNFDEHTLSYFFANKTFEELMLK